MLLTTTEVAEAAEDMSKEVTGFMAALQSDFGQTVLGLLWKIAVAVLIYVVGVFIIKILRKLMKKNFERTNVDLGVRQFTDSLIKFVLYAILLFVIFAHFGVNTTSIAAILASATVAISLALQGTLSNFAGGILILVTKPFVVGDYIVEDNNKNEGTVKEIQLFYTKLMTIENKMVVIPNSMLTSNSLTNYTEKDERRLDLKVDIAYDSDLKMAKELIEHLLDANEHIRSDKEKLIFVDSLGESSVVIGIRAWIPTEEYWPTRWKLLEDIKLTFDEHGIEIPYQQVMVHTKENS